MGTDLSVNYISLYKYLDVCNELDKRKIIYFVSKHLKGLHNSCHYIPYLNMKMIMVNPNNLSDVHFKEISDGLDDSEFEKYKTNNIYELAIISFAAYLPNYNLSNNGLLNSSVIRDKFDDFSFIFNTDDVDYYRDVLVNNNISYYSDYIDDLEKKSGNNVNNNRVYSYSTREGRLMVEKDAAFTSYLLLYVNIAVIGLLFGLLLIYLQ